MRRRLFWKILVGSWLIFILIVVSHGLLYLTVVPSVRPWGDEVISRFGHLELTAAAHILEVEGDTGLDDFRAHLPAGSEFSVMPGDTPIVGGVWPYETLSQEVRTPSGPVTLMVRMNPLLFLPPTPAPLKRIPLQLLVVDFSALFLFSGLIARYLAGPIQRLSAGLARIANGDLAARVGQQLGHRRDELADLARDFDLMAERLQQLLRSRDQLLHDVSHELRSPLTRLLLALDLARAHPERSIASLDRIEYEGQRLNELVGELLTMSRAEFNAGSSESYFAVEDLIDTITVDARFEAEPKAVRVETFPRILPHDAGGTIVKGSPGLLRRGIENIVRNAVRFSKEGQAVTVRLTAIAHVRATIRIEVADQGPGVPNESLERIFEPFVRLDGPAQDSGGFGLGLAIARSAARAHGGKIWAVNNPTEGLTVIMELPVETVSLVPHRPEERRVEDCG